MLESIINSVRNIFAIPDLRKRVIFTLLMLIVYRLGAHIRTPNIDPEVLERIWGQVGSTLFGVLDLFSGGNFRVISIFGLGITPYITASIILQLMTVVSPSLKALQEEGELGRRKITQYTRYLTVVLCAIQSLGIAYWLQSQPGLVAGGGGIGFILMTILTLTTGTTFIMWLGEQITERGVGNGISLIIFAGIVIGLPNAIRQIYDKLTDPGAALGIIIMLAIMLIIVAAIVFVERGQRRITINYARRIVGRRTMGSQSTHMPLRVNMGGVIPVIFAASILAVPQTLLGFWPTSKWVQSLVNIFHGGHPVYLLIYVSGIIFFTFFYVSIIFPTDEVADNLRKHGGFIPGIRPGKHTSEYLNTTLTRLTTVGALYLAIISLIPQFMLNGVQIDKIPWIGEPVANVLSSTPGLGWILTGLGFNFYFGGTSLLIVVGVAMDTVSQIESQLIMRHYDGFVKGKRIRGRRG